MINLTFIDNAGGAWYRINKTTAKKLYNAGVDVCFCPSNLRPFSMWAPEFVSNKTRDIETAGEADFDKLLNYFTFYNCINAETGRRVNFYIKKGVQI